VYLLLAYLLFALFKLSAVIGWFFVQKWARIFSGKLTRQFYSVKLSTQLTPVSESALQALCEFNR